MHLCSSSSIQSSWIPILGNSLHSSSKTQTDCQAKHTCVCCTGHINEVVYDSFSAVAQALILRIGRCQMRGNDSLWNFLRRDGLAISFCRLWSAQPIHISLKTRTLKFALFEQKDLIKLRDNISQMTPHNIFFIQVQRLALWVHTCQYVYERDITRHWWDIVMRSQSDHTYLKTRFTGALQNISTMLILLRYQSFPNWKPKYDNRHSWPKVYRKKLWFKCTAQHYGCLERTF